MSTELRDEILDERLLDVVRQDGPVTCQQLVGSVGTLGNDIWLVARLKALTDAGCLHRADNGLYSVAANGTRGPVIGPDERSAPFTDAVERHLLAAVEEAEQALAVYLGEGVTDALPGELLAAARHARTALEAYRARNGVPAFLRPQAD